MDVSEFKLFVYRSHFWQLRYACADKKTLETATASCHYAGNHSRWVWSLMMVLLYNGMIDKALILAEEGAVLKVREADAASFANDILEMRETWPYFKCMETKYKKKRFIVNEFYSAINDNNLSLAKKLAILEFPKLRKGLQRIIDISKGAKRHPWPFPLAHVIGFVINIGFILIMLFIRLYDITAGKIKNKLEKNRFKKQGTWLRIIEPSEEAWFLRNVFSV